MKRAVFVLLAASAAYGAPVDGVITNGTTGKPQPNATVTLFRVGQNGPETLESVKADAAGHFVLNQDVPGPRLIQAAYDGVTYNHMLPPGTPSSNIEIKVYQSSTKQGGATVDQHMLLLEPQPDGKMAVSESFGWKNAGKTTFNDPDKGTLQFYLPPESQGQVTVRVLAPGGMPIQRAADKTSVPNVYKVDFPIKPGDSRIDLSYGLPFTSPGEFGSKTYYKGAATRVIVPPGVTLAGAGLTNLGQGPMNATIYSTEANDFKVQVTGAGVLRGEGGENQQQSESGGTGIKQIMPKLFASSDPKDGFNGAVDSVKWIIVLVLGMLTVGFVMLYRAGVVEPEQPKAKSGRR